VAHTAEEAHAVILTAMLPFDILLIDYRLGPGQDGIMVMQELHQLNPDAGAVIFTGLDEANIGLRAYQAGAQTYLVKPIDPSELQWILRSFEKSRMAEHERTWLKTLNEIAEQTLHALSLCDTADSIVRGGQSLGFERARLWLMDDDGNTLIGASQVGNTGLDNFVGFRMPIADSSYAQYALQYHEPVKLSRQVFGPSYLETSTSAFTPSVGEFVYIPLWVGGRCLGLISLDSVTSRLSIRPEHERLLSLFGHQAAAALERARLYEQEGREIKVLNAIGKRVIARGVAVDLEALLREVYSQIRDLMAVDGFIVALHDPETGKLNYPLRLEGEAVQGPRWSELNEGLLAHLIEQNENLFCPTGTKEYREKHQINLLGAEAKSWMGVPLRLEDKPIGALAVEIIHGFNTFQEKDWRIFQAIAEQVAGVIQTVRLKEQESRKRHQLDVLHRATEVMMELGLQDEDQLWRATLTVATAGQALGFNRAAIFQAQDQATRLQGRMGVGHFDKTEARDAWERDKAANLDIDGYLGKLRQGQCISTPVEQAVREMEFPLDGGAFSEVLQQKQRTIIRAAEVVQRLPQRFVERFGVTDYAILPLHAGSKAIGLMIVDNIHDRKPLYRSTLEYLDLLLTQSTLILESQRQRQAKDQLIDLNHAVMNQLDSRPLGETLAHVCRTAQTVTGADYLVIYPFKPGQGPHEYDFDNVGRVGQKNNVKPYKPRSPRMTKRIVQNERPLVINDVTSYIGGSDAENSIFLPRIRSEHIRGIIGTALRDANTNEPLGIMYLSYRAPQIFTAQDIHQAEAFASIAAVAIRNTRDRESQLEVLRKALHQALRATNENQVIISLIYAARELLAYSDARVRLFLRGWQQSSDQGTIEVRHQYYLDPQNNLKCHTITDIYRGITGWAIKHGRSVLVIDVKIGELASVYYADPDDTIRSELDVPIMFNNQVLGVFNIESPQIGRFTGAHRDRIERLATGAALALDNIRRQQRLQNILEAAKVITTVTELKPTLESIKQVIYTAVPNLSVLTIWHIDPVTERVVLGTCSGVGNQQVMEQVELQEGSVLWKVMRAEAPLFAPNIANDQTLNGAFTENEHIVSAAAFPLRVEGKPVGAMFFNYRQQHEFTDEERFLFHVFAEIVAASIHDASLLQKTQTKARHLLIAQEITKEIGTTLELDEVLHKIMGKLCELFPHAQPCVLTYDEDDHALVFTTASRTFYEIDHPYYHISARIPVDDDGPESSIAALLARKSLESKQVELENLPDVFQDSRYLGLNSTTQSELCLTLMNHEQLLGVLALESSQPGTFDEEHEALIHSIGQQISIAIDRANRSAELRFQTTVAAAMAWAAQIAHDINREVGVIRRRAYLLRKELLSEKGHKYTNEIEGSAKRLAGTLRETNLRQPQDLETLQVDVHLGRWLKEIINRADIDLRWEPHCPGVTVRVQPDALKHALRNLVRNALEAMKGTGTIRVETRLKSERRIEIRFSDTGTGIAPDVQQAIFQEPKSSKGDGRGFGLIIVRHLIESMEGSIVSIPSAPGSGAVFVITLPVTDITLEVGHEHQSG
jgi:GAF domain-containing protein